MTRLIIIPQYPSHLRYQSWWLTKLEKEYNRYFDEVDCIAPTLPEPTSTPLGMFAPTIQAARYEIEQIERYLAYPLLPSDVLLVCDISFPGLFSSVLFHKRPRRCFAICHGSSLNKFDIFSKDRWPKRLTETGTSRLFEKVFVATEYHQTKLKWPNTHIVRFPLPDVAALAGEIEKPARLRRFISVARKGQQKISAGFERKIEDRTQTIIHRYYQTSGNDWKSYYRFVASGQFMLISSREETYGYQVVDALAVGTTPIAPRALSYPELLPDCCLYEPRNVNSLLDAVYTCERQAVCPPLWPDRFIEETSNIMLSGP